jgi:hypothetical protein
MAMDTPTATDPYLTWDRENGEKSKPWALVEDADGKVLARYTTAANARRAARKHEGTTAMHMDEVRALAGQPSPAAERSEVAAPAEEHAAQDAERAEELAADDAEQDALRAARDHATDEELAEQDGWEYPAPEGTDSPASPAAKGPQERPVPQRGTARQLGLVTGQVVTYFGRGKSAMHPPIGTGTFQWDGNQVSIMGAGGPLLEGVDKTTKLWVVAGEAPAGALPEPKAPKASRVAGTDEPQGLAAVFAERARTQPLTPAQQARVDAGPMLQYRAAGTDDAWTDYRRFATKAKGIGSAAGRAVRAEKLGTPADMRLVAVDGRVVWTSEQGYEITK